MKTRPLPLNVSAPFAAFVLVTCVGTPNALAHPGGEGVGTNNTASGPNSVVGGGSDNVSSGNRATIGGGAANTSSGHVATIGGGQQNTANTNFATVGGGVGNTVSGFAAMVGGGQENRASGEHAFVGGGYGNVASATNATVGGGYTNTASGLRSMVGGGGANAASGFSSTISGGGANAATNLYATVGGGLYNAAGGQYATVSGGWGNTAKGNFSVVPGGARAYATNDGAFVWSGVAEVDTVSTNAKSFTVRAPGGVRFITATNNTLAGVRLRPNATSWTILSDRESKTDFQPIKPREVLSKLAAMPVTSWRYKHDPSRRYIGPTSQDFMAAFQLGNYDKGIDTLDADGVAFAAIKGLVEELKERDKEIEKLKAMSSDFNAMKVKLKSVERQLSSLPPAP